MSSRTSRGPRSLPARATRSAGASASSHSLGPTFERAPAPQIAVHPVDGTLRAINARARVLLDISDRASIELCADRFWVDSSRFFRILENASDAALNGGFDEGPTEVQLQTLNGRRFWARVDASRVEDLVLIGLQDIGLYKRETEALRDLAERDSLTGLPNRRAYDERVELTYRRARATGSPLCLALFDADHFKRVNDQLGHAVGDRVLEHLAQLARANLRRADFLARFGGEEFVIVMPDTSLEEATAVLERLRETIAGSPLLAREGLTARVTISIGVSALGDGDRVEELLERADSALYEAKAAGRNLVVTQ